MTLEILKVVFDCGVFLQGLISKSGPAVACLELIEQDKIKLVISPETLAEIERCPLTSAPAPEKS